MEAAPQQKLVYLVFVSIFLVAFALFIFSEMRHPAAPKAIIVTSPFVYSFNVDGILNEAGSMQDSSSPYWWLNSGGQLLIQNGIGATMQGDAPIYNQWRLLYTVSNPIDTDGGLHPQNLFRLITRSQWNTMREEVTFRVTKDNFSQSSNRNSSNGVLLFSRYFIDGQTLYYAGVRVDGTAVIKKKIKGVYYTLAEKQIFAGTYRDSRDAVNLIPHGEWISLREETVTLSDGTVTIRLFMKSQNDALWSLIAQAQDTGQFEHTPPIISPGYAGIRTDFMDVQFQSFILEIL